MNVSYADTCPPIDSFLPETPPPGWTLLPSKYFEGYTYHFGSAIHSLNGTFYYGQMLCVYEACYGLFCPSYTILSDKLYENPKNNRKPWDAKITFAETLRCAPDNHDPSVCVFGD